MPSIDSYLSPLHQGIWEVIIPRDQVSEPLDNEWILSKINVPTPGCIASYRKGKYHLHETRDAWRVHLDRYDPSVHPILHLIDDAPLLLMISETFITLVQNTRHTFLPSIPEERLYQTGTYRMHLILGLLIGILGLGFILTPEIAFFGITSLLIPTGVLFTGLLILVNGSSLTSEGGQRSREELFRGVAIIVTAGILYLIPPLFWGASILLILAGWMFASAVMLLSRVIHGKKAVPEGVISRGIIGTISLILGGFCLLAPVQIFMLFMNVLGILTLTLGLVIILIGFRLRNMMRQRT